VIAGMRLVLLGGHIAASSCLMCSCPSGRIVVVVRVVEGRTVCQGISRLFGTRCAVQHAQAWDLLDFGAVARAQFAYVQKVTLGFVVAVNQ
jgi:hypothetical protein